MGIEETKAELVEAKRIRKNRMEYDALAKVIQTHPARDTSEARLEQVQQELQQFHLLVSTIHQMQDLLAEDEDLDPKSGNLSSVKSPASQESMEVEICD